MSLSDEESPVFDRAGVFWCTPVWAGQVVVGLFERSLALAELATVTGAKTDTAIRAAVKDSLMVSLARRECS